MKELTNSFSNRPVTNVANTNGNHVENNFCNDNEVDEQNNEKGNQYSIFRILKRFLSLYKVGGNSFCLILVNRYYVLM